MTEKYEGLTLTEEELDLVNGGVDVVGIKNSLLKYTEKHPELIGKLFEIAKLVKNRDRDGIVKLLMSMFDLGTAMEIANALMKEDPTT